MFSQTNYHQIFINPAYAGNSPYPKLMLGYRNQWPGLNSAFTTYYISYEQYLKSISSNFGFCLNRDIQGNGVFSKTSGDLVYNYPVELNNNALLSLGMQVSISQFSLSNGSFTLPSDNPYSTISTSSEIIPGRSKIYPDFSAGIAAYFTEQYLIGFSVHHLNKPMETNYSNTSLNYTLPMEVNFQIMAKYNFAKPRRELNGIILLPGLYIQYQRKLSYITIGSNLVYNGLIVGVWVRNYFPFNIPTIIAHTGFTTGALEFVYSYDAWMPGNSNNFKIYGAHEVTFISHFKYNDPKRKMRTIKCPNISR